MKCKNCCRALIVLMSLLLALQPLYAQQGEAPVGLKIVVVQGDNAKNVTEEIPLSPLSVRVEAANNQPVPNAAVTFTSPETGASGEFANDSRTFTVNTDEQGLAIARGYHPNSVSGAYSIRVRALWRDETAAIDIRQRNVAPGQGVLGKRIAIIAIAAAAAAAIIAARSHSSSSTSSNAPTITFGGGAVGAPR